MLISDPNYHRQLIASSTHLYTAFGNTNASYRELHTPILLQFPIRIPGDFPRIAIRVGEIPGITSPMDLLGRFQEPRSNRLDFG
jgi:hypothetical protein